MGTIFIETISEATAQKREHQQQKQKRVSVVRSPDGVFMISNSEVILFRQFSSNLQFHFVLRLFSNNQRIKTTQNRTVKKSTEISEGKCQSKPLMVYLR